jgi:hypothetical protein
VRTRGMNQVLRINEILLSFSDTWRIISFTCESVWIIHTKYFVTSLIKIQKKKKENLTQAKASLRSRFTQLSHG